MTTYNKSEIMKEAHQLYKSSKRMGWASGKNFHLAESKQKTGERLADEYGVSERTIRNGAYYGD